MRIGPLISSVALALLVPLAASSATGDDSKLSVEVLASSENAGPVEWRLWRATLSGPGALQRVSIHVPEGALSAAALGRLEQSTTVGAATVSQRLSSDNGVTAESPLVVAPCDAGLPDRVATLQFSASGSSPCVAIAKAADGLDLDVNLEGATGVRQVDLRFDNSSTEAGPLLEANPDAAVERDTSATGETTDGSFTDVVREIAGGLTRVELRAASSDVVYRQPLVLEGRVLRGGEPSAGERVVLHEYYFSPANSDFGPAVGAVTDAGGRFQATVRPGNTVEWGAWSSRLASAGPRLNLLFGILPRPIVVHAPKPPIAKRVLGHATRGAVRARIKVQSPIWRMETLWCRLYLAGRQVAFRRFPFNSSALVFGVRGERGAKVRAAIGRWEGPLIAPGWSRTIRL